MLTLEDVRREIQAELSDMRSLPALGALDEQQAIYQRGWHDALLWILARIQGER